MKALVLREYNVFSYEDVPMPSVRDDEVLVRVRACSICGSDVHGMDGSTGRRIPPVIMGHEASGTIETVGTGVRDFAPGDRVTFDSTVYCGDCYFCRRGEINLCDNRRVLGVSCGEYNYPGAFAEYIAVPRRVLYRLPDAVSFERAAMVEPLSIAFHALRRSPVSLGDTAVVVGAGMIGSLVIQLLHTAGCGRIIAVDLVQEKLDLAKKLGADVCLRSDQTDVPAEIARLTEGRGADVAFEVVGIAATLRTAIASLRKGGSLTLVGNLSPTAEFAYQAVVTRQLTLYGSCSSAGEYPECLSLIASGKADVDSFISAVAPLSEGADWFRRLKAGEPGLMKVILRP
ncbi:MAG: galactitol-1-phosphate 5-dehydrogenase [Clostridia bacterium]|nr:galactitol-1-phosphate 5-dehydrogenase [Clostridia bacterium]